ncbi:MAG TPA: hypothetical protein VJB97_00845 [Candidatus Paceibacterota bacterium]
MLYLFSGADSEKARATIRSLVAKSGLTELRITDAHSLGDLDAALSGSGMFDAKRVVVFDNVFEHEELGERLRAALPELNKSNDTFLIYERSPSAELRRTLEKHATTAERFDAPKTKREDSIFSLANYLQRGKKKELWVGLQREFMAGKQSEAIHGFLFWAAKQALLRNANDARARRLVAELAELPHRARRRGFELEYALEKFVLTSV